MRVSFFVKYVLIITVITSFIPINIFAEKITVFYNLATPQHEFAANDIKTALEVRNYSIEFRDITELTDSFSGKKLVIALQSDIDIIALLDFQAGTNLTNLGEQAYALRTTSSPDMSYWVIGGDDNGAMYGGLQIAENINFHGFSESYNEEESPYLKSRGIKFNIPLDKESPTYFYDNNGTSHKEAIRHVWDMSFWTTWFDEMARNRYNVLSLWSPHPFTSMLNMEDEYPGIAIQGVMGYDDNGNDLQINKMTIDEKVAFWQQVMKYGKERGFDTYFCTWNIFLSTAEDKYGLSDSPQDLETRTYLRKCMKEFLETYPDLAGFGITVGENMGGINDREKEEWAWDTYGMGMMEYAQANPDRDLVFIHRQHQGNLTDIMDFFKPLNDLPNVRFDLSFKYSQAHAYAAVKPGYWKSSNMETGLAANNLKSWLTVRNDDFYFLHWADAQFVRDYIKNFPEIGKFVDAFYIGSDGWTFTKEFTSKNPYYMDRNALSIQKTWYTEKLWGRVSYNPSVSDELFKSHLDFKYPEVPSDELFRAWSVASRAIQLANEQVTGTWDLDFRWWPEGWTSQDAFQSLNDTKNVKPMNGSNLCSFSNTASGICQSKVSALTNASQIEEMANEALTILGQMSSGSNTELKLNMRDLEAMANLSLYNANKFRAAVYLIQGKQAEARIAMGKACCFWNKYTSIMDELYIGVKLQRNKSFSNWHENDAKVLKDFTDLGGTGSPNCTDQYPQIYIGSPINNAYFIAPSDVTVDVSADAGENSIDRVELRINGNLVDTDYDFPYSFDLTRLSAGSYTLNAFVYDNLGATVNDSVKIRVYDPSSFNTVPWIEDFSLEDGTTIDDGPTSWTSNRPEGNFFVQNKSFIVNGAGGEGVLTTSEIDISEGPVDISLKLWSVENLESDDYIELYKIVDGGKETLIGSKNDNQDVPTIIQGNAVGNKLVLKIHGKVSYAGEYYFLDDLSVTNKVGNAVFTLNSIATNGLITVSPSGGKYDSSQVVNLTVYANSGYRFTGWSDDLSGTSNPGSIIMDENKTVRANFELIPNFSLISNATNGTIELSPPGGSYFEGTTVYLNAIPDGGYRFTNWSGDLSGNENPVSIEMYADKNITAVFSFITSATELSYTTTPSQNLLKQNFPNPFSDKCFIPYQVKVPSNVKISVYDVWGRLDRILIDEYHSEGDYLIELKANDIEGVPLSNGLYMYRFETDDGIVQQKKTILLK